MLKKRLTIMVPAFNEEGNLEGTVKEIELGISNKLKTYEIIIINDFSTDNTRQIAEKLAKKNKKIRVINNKKNMGLGFNYREGIKYAKFEYYMYIPGDNQFPHQSLTRTLDLLGKSDIIIPYVTNMHIRPPIRQAISFLFTFLINALFNLRISYYNSHVIHRLDYLCLVPKKTDGFAYQAEILIRLLKAGASFKEIGYEMRERQVGSTNAFTFKNVQSVLGTVLSLFWETMVQRQLPIPSKLKELIAQTRIKNT